MAPPELAPPVVSAEELWRSFAEGERQRQVLSGASLQVAAGESVALLGRSGSGKSTLLHLLGGIDRPDRGRVSLLGEDITRLAEPRLTLLRRRQVGFVYQFFNLLPTLTVAENIGLPLELLGQPESRIAARVTELLAAVGLTDRGDAFPEQLSGGEQQRVAVARALAHRPALLLADEPTGNLDATSGQAVLQLLLELTGEAGASLVVVTHSLAVARCCDRILTLEAGRLQQRQGAFAW